MAAYTFEIPVVAYFGLGILVAIPIMLRIFSIDWTARFLNSADQRERRRLMQATVEMNRILGERDRLEAQYAASLRHLEARHRDSEAAAAGKISALQEQLEKRDAMLKRLKLRLKEQSAAAGTGRRDLHAGAEDSRRPLAKQEPGATARRKIVKRRDANAHALSPAAPA